jgi:hypothetical protein
MSQKKQTILAFFDNKEVVSTNYVPRSTTMNVKYMLGALRKF